MNRIRRKKYSEKLALLIGSAFVLALILVALVFAFSTCDRHDAQVMAGTSLPMLGMAAGAAVLTDEKFRETMLDGVEKITGDQKEFKKTFDEFQTETKTAIGELTAIKNAANSQAEKLVGIERAQLGLRSEMNLGRDPIQRIARNEVSAAHLLAAIARAVKVNVPKSAMDIIGKTSLVEGSTPGSTYIIGQLAAEIYDVLNMYGAWNTLGVRNVGTKTTTYPVSTARTVAGWITTGGGQISEDTTKAGTSVDLTVQTIAVLLGVSRELIEDAEVDVVSAVLQDMGQAAAYRLDYACFAAAAGANATDGGYTSISSGGTAAAAATGNTTIAALDLADFVRCLTTVASGILRRGCKWWMHPTTLAKICQIRDLNGRPIFQTALEAPAPGAIGSILGYPVVIADAFPSTDSAGSVVAAFGDPQAGVVGIRKAFEFAAAEQFYFDYNKIAYRGLIRAGFKIRAATGFAMLTLAAS